MNKEIPLGYPKGIILQKDVQLGCAIKPVAMNVKNLGVVSSGPCRGRYFLVPPKKVPKECGLGEVAK